MAVVSISRSPDSVKQSSSLLHPSMRLTIVSEFPRRVREIENLWIPMSDGCQLAARIWLPEDAEASPVPAILEYLPYRKGDATAERDALTHPYFAGHGYAGVRVDMRGTGESDGLLSDEYLKQEQDDALEVIAWLARQPWCNGSVGMIGISWGGFNGLQVAARRPPALKAIVTLCSTDDRYADDTHYMGGAVLGANLSWASTMIANQMRPPDPALVGGRWREMWQERLANLPLFHELWLQHQHRDDYWKHGSVCEDFSSIECAVYAVGGWDDSYTNPIPRLLSGLKAPRKGLIGPWAHRFPHFGLPGPQIGFLQECLRWWDHWLKGIDTGIMNEPMLRAFMQDSVRPAAWYASRPGRWIAEKIWPAPGVKRTRWYLTPDGIAAGAGPEMPLLLASPESTGAHAGMWCPHGLAPDEPTDQREDDAKSLKFDSEPLRAQTEILGAPVVEVEIMSDKPCAKLVARLCDVHPDGASTRVCYGILNLTHHAGHDAPMPLEPGRRYQVRIQLNDVGYAFPPGHRIRLALSSTYWPLTWPSPEPTQLTVYAGAATLTLPERARQPEDDLEPFLAAEASAPEPRTTLRRGRSSRNLSHDIATGETTFLLADDHGRARIDRHGLEIGSSREHEYRITEGNPLSAWAETRWTNEMGRGGWQVRATSRVAMTSTREHFIIHAAIDAFEGDRRVCSRNWERRIKRELV
jgi:putative CocE/NonD family hydrolase